MRKQSIKCKCGQLRSSNHRYCVQCKASYMREWRKTHRLSGEALKRANARSYVHMYIKRGKINKMPCEICGDISVEAHHKDYSKPLEVNWLCRLHHLKLHGKMA